MPAKLTQDRKDKIIELYKKGSPACDIAKWLNHDRGTVLQILHEANILIRRGAPKPQLSDKQCQAAKEIYESGGSVQDVMNKFNVGRTLAYTALRRSNTKLNVNKGGPDSGNWKGGRRLNGEGYVEVWLPYDHPLSSMCAGGSHYAREHRIIMAESLGRPLNKDEQVHHINGDRSDNRIENLQLRVGNHGSGQRYCCADCGSSNLKAVALS